MRKRLLIMLVLGMVLVPFALSPAAAKTLKIGSMSPLTGPYAADGNDIKNGTLTAIEIFEEEGGIPGFDKIELFPQDTACDPKQAVAAANPDIDPDRIRPGDGRERCGWFRYSRFSRRGGGGYGRARARR